MNSYNPLRFFRRGFFCFIFDKKLKLYRMKKQNQLRLFIALALPCLLLFSCGSDDSNTAEKQKQREQEIADSVAKMLTGKSLKDSANVERMEKVKQGKMEEAEYKKADASDLKNLVLEYDYDNKLFNKTSDVDGKIYNHSGSKVYKNIQMKVVGKDKKGNVTTTFMHTEYITLLPNSSKKIRIKFKDSEKTKNAVVTIVAAEEKQ